MKNRILICFVFLLLILLVVSGCKKAEVVEPAQKETKAPPEEKIDIDSSKAPEGSEAEGILNIFKALQEELG